MKLIFVALGLATVPIAQAAEPAMPIASGTYEFMYRDTEFPGSRGFPVVVTVDGRSIRIENVKAHAVIPIGLLHEGNLMWNTAIEQWIVGRAAADRTSDEVGGCTGGPPTVEAQKKEIWGCIGGP